MNVKSYGNSAFVFKSKKTKLLTNPDSQQKKVNIKNIEPDILLLSHSFEMPEGDFYTIASPGEYEVQDIFVYGYAAELKDQDSTQADIYMIDIEGVHIGFIDREVESIREWVLKEMGIVNVLFVPISPDEGMKLSKIKDLVNKIEPQIVVPMNYTKESLEEFIASIGVKSVERVDNLSVNKSEFSEDDMPMRCVVLEVKK